MEETVELPLPQCGRILTKDRTKSKRGIAAPCGRPPYTKRASHKKSSVFRLFTLGEWRTDGPRAQIWATTNSSWVAFQALAGPLLPVVSGSFLLWSPLPGTLYHLQLLSDRNFVRALLVHQQPGSWFTCSLDPAAWICPILRPCVLVDGLLLAILIFYSKFTTLYSSRKIS